MSDFWEEADKLVKTLGHKVVCCTVSKFGMCAYHTSAAFMDPIGDWKAIAGETIPQGLKSAPAPDGQILVRPGFEQQVQQQIADFRARRATRPLDYTLAGEGPTPVLPAGPNL